MTDYLSGIISVLASFQLLFVAAFLISNKKGNRRNNSLLGILFLLFSLSLGDFAIRISGIVIPNQALHLIDDGFFFLYGPILYFYVRGVVFQDFKFRVRNLVHLLPFALYCILLIYILAILDPTQQNQLTENIATVNLPIWMYLASIFIYIYNLIYIWFAYKTVRSYGIIVRNKFSSLNKISLNWLMFIIQSFAVITIIAMVHNVIPAFKSLVFLYATLLILLVYTFFFINRVLVKALNQPEIFAGIELKEVKEKYAGSNLEEDEVSDHFIQLQALLENEKLYLNPELILQDLADRLQISSRTLSQVINQGSEGNFYDLINSYRCQKAKVLMAESDPKVTIQEILFQAGFNSKSSFNKEFKKLTGFTPTAYRKSIRKS